MTKNIGLAELLAYRDGELEEATEGNLVAADVEAALAADPALAQQLQQLLELRHELNALPAEEPPPELWEQIQRVAEQKLAAEPEQAPAVQLNLTSQAESQPPIDAQAVADDAANAPWFSLPQLRLATAASVFLVGLLASALWLRDLPEAGSGDVQLALENGAALETLVNRSRRLEAAVQSQVVSADAEPSRAQRALMFRIADLDAELNSLQQEAMHPDLKERLWRQRVELLETLMEIQRFQMREQADF